MSTHDELRNRLQAMAEAAPPELKAKYLQLLSLAEEGAKRVEATVEECLQDRKASADYSAEIRSRSAARAGSEADIVNVMQEQNLILERIVRRSSA